MTGGIVTSTLLTPGVLPTLCERIEPGAASRLPATGV